MVVPDAEPTAPSREARSGVLRAARRARQTRGRRARRRPIARLLVEVADEEALPSGFELVGAVPCGGVAEAGHDRSADGGDGLREVEVSVGQLDRLGQVGAGACSDT